MSTFEYRDLFFLGNDETKYRLMTKDHISTVDFEGNNILKICPKALTILANQAMRDVSFMLRTKHLEKLNNILRDSEASPNDLVVAKALLRNAEVASKGILPLCQDTGTATIIAKKGQQVWTGVKDEEYLCKGIFNAYMKENLRYSQNIPLNLHSAPFTSRSGVFFCFAKEL